MSPKDTPTQVTPENRLVLNVSPQTIEAILGLESRLLDLNERAQRISALLGMTIPLVLGWNNLEYSEQEQCAWVLGLAQDYSEEFAREFRPIERYWLSISGAKDRGEFEECEGGRDDASSK